MPVDLDLDAMSTALAHTLDVKGGRPRLARREPNPYGHGRSEILHWRLPDGAELKVFCKRDDPSDPHADVAYEARVYRDVLEPLGVSTPAYYGSGVDRRTGQAWLLLEFARGADDRDGGGDDAEALVLAAGWLGSFQAAFGEAFTTPPSFLKRYDAPYYAGLARRAAANASTDDRLRLDAVAQRIGSFLQPLMARRSTLVHTDLYGDNLLLCNREVVVPLDWEMAAVDLGEADLAFLVHGWDEVEEACASAYRRSRWPDGAPGDFPHVLKAATLCLDLYRLAGGDWADENGGARCTSSVLRLSSDLGLLDGVAA